MIMDGEAVPLGDSIVSFAQAVSPRDRIRALAFRPSHTGIVFSHRIAAWIHGCGPFPRRIDLTVQAHHRYGLPTDPRVRIRRYRLSFTRDTEIIDSTRVTTPLRTAIHLLIDERCDGTSMTSAGLLAGGIDALEAALTEASRIKERQRKRALERLATIQPLVTL